MSGRLRMEYPKRTKHIFLGLSVVMRTEDAAKTKKATGFSYDQLSLDPISKEKVDEHLDKTLHR